MKYFARLRAIYQYPYSGQEVWCVVDSMGGAFPVGDEATAVTESLLRNAMLAEQEVQA